MLPHSLTSINDVFVCYPSPTFPPSSFFFFNDTPPTEIYTLSLHDALPICISVTARVGASRLVALGLALMLGACATVAGMRRSEEHTSELQSRGHLVCRLLLEKKKKKT